MTPALQILRADADRLDAAAREAQTNAQRFATTELWDTYTAALARKWAVITELVANEAANRYVEAVLAECAMRHTFAVRDPQPASGRIAG